MSRKPRKPNASRRPTRKGGIRTTEPEALYERLERMERRLRSLEVIVGLDDLNFELPEGIEATTPLSLVLLELGLEEEELEPFIARLKQHVDAMRAGAVLD